jgi:hypothetical protein
MYRGDDSRAIDGALREALQADASGQLRTRVCEWAAQVWWLACQGQPEAEDPAGRHASELFRQLAEALRTALLADGPVLDGKPPYPSPPAGAAVTVSHIPPWLAQARDEIVAVSGGRVRISARTPAELWQQLHMSILSLPPDQMEKHRSLLGEPSPDYLIPPQPELGVAGLTWSAAAEHKLASRAIASWPPGITERYGSLRQTIAITFTMVDLAPNLFVASGQGTTITPADSREARRHYQDRVLRAITQLGAADLDSSSEVDWLSALDETLRSVFPLPMPSRFSWWGTRLQESFTLLSKCAARMSPGAQVSLAKTAASLDEQQRKEYAGHDNVAIQPFRPEEDGQVLWPLRAYVLLPVGPDRAVMTRAGRVVYGHHQGLSYPGSSGR